MYLAVAKLGVDGVAAAAEVDEIQELEVLLERLGRDVESFADLDRGDRRLCFVPAAVEQVRKERLEQAEALRRHGARGSLLGLEAGLLRRRGDIRELPFVPLLDELEIRAHLPAKLRRGERDGPPVLAQDPGRELPQVGIVRDEAVVLDA